MAVFWERLKEDVRMSEPILKIYDKFYDVYKKDHVGSKVDQCALIIRLSEYIEEVSGRLVYEERNMDCRDIAAVLGKKKDKVARIVTDLITNGVIMGFDGAYFVNPQYISKAYSSEEEKEG
jgi:predicted transcriptional regulator